MTCVGNVGGGSPGKIFYLERLGKPLVSSQGDPGTSMPNRIIKESARTSPTLAALSDGAERLFWRLTTAVDDYGRFEADADVINGSCLSRLKPKWTTRKVERCLVEMGRQNGPDDQPLAIFYRVKGRVYGELVTFLEHQRKRDSKPKFPGLEEGERVFLEPVAASCGNSPQVAALSESESENVNERRERETRGGTTRVGPRTAAEAVVELELFTISEATRKWAEGEGIPNSDAYLDEFKDYWRSVGAKRRNGQIIRDWDATFRNRLRDLKADGKLKKKDVWA